MSREYIWSCELNSSNKEYAWEIDEEPSDDKDEHDTGLLYSLLLKQAVLGHNASSGEENIVELESVGYMGTTFKYPLLRLKNGLTSQCHLDILLSHPGSKIRLIQGSGPVYIWGQQLIELGDDEDYDEQNEDEEGSEEDEDNMEEESMAEEITDLKEDQEKFIGDQSRKRGPISAHSRAKKMQKLDVTVEGESEENIEKEDTKPKRKELHVDEEEEQRTPRRGKKSEQAAIATGKGTKASRSKKTA